MCRWWYYSVASRCLLRLKTEVDFAHRLHCRAWGLQACWLFWLTLDRCLSDLGNEGCRWEHQWVCALQLNNCFSISQMMFSAGRWSIPQNQAVLCEQNRQMFSFSAWDLCARVCLNIIHSNEIASKNKSEWDKKKKKDIQFLICLLSAYLISSVSGTLVYGSMALTLLLSSTGCGK